MPGIYNALSNLIFLKPLEMFRVSNYLKKFQDMFFNICSFLDLYENPDFNNSSQH